MHNKAPIKISKAKARRLALHGQLLDGRTQLAIGKEGVAQTIERLGYIQVDTISAIERAHHHTLWTRQADYTPEMLHEMEAIDRRVFEYWGHALSYLPMNDYRYYRPRMNRFRDPYVKWEKERLEKYGHLMKPVLERIRREGPLGQGDIDLPEAETDPRGIKVALEMLFWQGDLMIAERRNFRRIFDLPERVIPGHVNTGFPDEAEVGRFFVRRALRAYGIARRKEIRDHIQATENKIIASALDELVDSGEVVTVNMEKSDDDYFALTDIIEDLAGFRRLSPRLYLLSPFDNLIILRDRLKKLFDFDYALECYVTPSKRRHGYFVLPILWGESFVGRLDPKADRKKRIFFVKNLLMEPDYRISEAFLNALATKLSDLARFNGCSKVTVERTSPASIKKALASRLRKMQ